MKYFSLGLALLAVHILVSASQAAANNRLVVYIECKNPKQPELPLFKGTGVIVSPEGHVLTAEHVMPEGYECLGAIENNTIAKRQLQVDFKDYQLSDKIDGKLLRFIASSGEEFEYANYCPAQSDNVGDVIVVKGFHGKSRGLPSATLGILSTYIPDHRGILETDANTVGGKSGGPVFLQGTNTIIGIVAGAEFDPSGLPAYYGVLTAEALVQFGILELAPICGGTQPATSPEIEEDKVAEATTAVVAPTESEAQTDEVAKTVDEVKTGAPQVEVAAAKTEPLDPKQIEAAMAMSKSDRKLVQESLSVLGFNTRGVDGVWGNNTRKAIAGWQRALGREPSGFIDPEQTKLLISSAASKVEESRATEVAASATTSNSPTAGSSGNSAQDLYNQAYVLFDQEEYSKAIELLNQAIKLEPQNARYLAERALNYDQMGQLNKALSDLNLSLKLDPSDVDATALRGWIHFDLGSDKQALVDFDRALKLNPGNQEAIEGRQVLCEETNLC